jgi:TRAP-type transport system small permease protein
LTTPGSLGPPLPDPSQPAAPAHPASLVATITRASSLLAAVALVVMVVALVVDVAMSNLFRRPIIGMFDLVESTLVVLVFMGFPATFLRGGHIAVDVVDHFVSPKTVDRLKWLAAAVSLLFLVFLAWQMVGPALDAFRFGERKQELGLPLWALWIPMILGIVLSAVALLAVLLRSVPPARKED